MQTVILYLMMLISSLVLTAQNKIEISMIGFENNNGTVKVGLYNSESNFLEREFKTSEATIKNQKAYVSFTNIPDGIYAICAYHDEDANNEFNMLMGFIPLESFGNSNNAPARFGPPKWEDAKFEVKNGTVIKQIIKL